MTSFYFYVLTLGYLIIISISGSRSNIHEIFLDPSEDPFLNPLIETVLHMNVKDILAIPKMNDHDLLHYILDGSNITRDISVRVDASVFDSLRDDQLKNQDTIDREWETLMISGPIVVGYMGNLLVLASKKDFPFRAPPGYVYRYIRYPNSFRATLAQTSSEMYNALMNAHTSMDRIQLGIKQVPAHVQTALKLITSASDGMLKLMLPRTLESISRLATESADVAKSTLTFFSNLQDLLAEIIELSASTQVSHEADIGKMNEQMVNSTLEQERLQANLEFIKNQYEQSKKALEAARKKYNDAMHQLSLAVNPQVTNENDPLSEIVGFVIDVVFNPIKAIGCLFSSCKNPSPQVDNTKFENAYAVAQLAKEELERAEQLHNEHFQLHLAEQNDLAKIMNQMAMLDLSVLNTEEIVKLLLEATGQIGLIREQWSRMVQFFSKLAVQAQSTQQVAVKDFVEVIQDAQNNNILVSQGEREFFIEFFKPTTETIESGAHLLYTMAKTYYAVSSEHMINQIAGISKLLALQTDAERQTHLKQASNNTLATSLKVTQLIQERHLLYTQELHKRQSEYQVYINGLLESQLTGVVG